MILSVVIDPIEKHFCILVALGRRLVALSGNCCSDGACGEETSGLEDSKRSASPDDRRLLATADDDDDDLHHVRALILIESH